MPSFCALTSETTCNNLSIETALLMIFKSEFDLALGIGRGFLKDVINVNLFKFPKIKHILLFFLS